MTLVLSVLLPVSDKNQQHEGFYHQVDYSQVTACPQVFYSS